MTAGLRGRMQLEKYAIKYLCGSRKARRKYSAYATFEGFLRERAKFVLAYTELGLCPFCKRKFKGFIGLHNHLKGSRKCGREFRELVNQLMEEYLASKGRR